MRQKKILFGLLLAFALLLGGAYALYTRLGQSMAPGRLAGEEPAASEGASGSASQRTPAPDFTVYDGEGNEVHLSDYAGKPVVLNSGPGGAGHARRRCRIFTKHIWSWDRTFTF